MEQIIFNSSYLLRPATFLEDLKAVHLFNHSNCSHPTLESVFAIERMPMIHSLKCTVPFSFVVPFAVTRCHSFPFAATRCQSLSLVAPLVLTRCTTRRHSLSFVVPLVVIRFHSLSFVVTRCHSLSFVFTRCTTRLAFYKRLFSHHENAKKSFIQFLAKVAKFSRSKESSKINPNKTFSYKIL